MKLPSEGDVPGEPGLLEMLERSAQYRECCRRFSDGQIRNALTEFAIGLEQQAKRLTAMYRQNASQRTKKRG